MAAQTIEDAIRGALKDAALINALDFAAFLKEKGLTPGESEKYWEIKRDGKAVCSLWIDGAGDVPGPWTVWSAEEPDSWAYWETREESLKFPRAEVSKQTREAAWANINFCGKCGGCANPGGRRKTILGRDFEGVCNAAMQFVNPNREALECAKEMVKTRLEYING